MLGRFFAATDWCFQEATSMGCDGLQGTRGGIRVMVKNRIAVKFLIISSHLIQITHNRHTNNDGLVLYYHLQCVGNGDTAVSLSHQFRMSVVCSKSHLLVWLLCLMQCMFHIITVLSFNSLRSSEAIWRHRSGSTLAQVMACCLTASSHYLNQCWLIISKVLWHSSQGNFMRDTSSTIH